MMNLVLDERHFSWHDWMIVMKEKLKDILSTRRADVMI